MKYAVLIGDGMSDYPLKELGGKTPLEVAYTPNMDWIAKNGLTGIVDNVPKGFQPASDIANLSIFGYDPKIYYSGRGPLEAAYIGVKLKKDEFAFRCNLVTVLEDKMVDFTAGHIINSEAERLIRFIDQRIGSENIKFYPGVSYRHLAVIKGDFSKTKCIPPHDITGKKIHKFLPKGKGSSLIKDLMNKSISILKEHKINKERIRKGENPANMIWLWGQGRTKELPSFKEKYGLTGSVITAVNLIKGIGILIGLEVINVPGATGYFDTNYKGKADYGLNSLKKHDIVFIHLEPPDEAGHMGDIKAKIKAIEDFDKLVVGRVLRGLQKFSEWRILVLPDHPTPISVMTHTADPVPFAMAGSHIKPDAISHFSEKEISRSKIKIKKGYKLLDFFFEIKN